MRMSSIASLRSVPHANDSDTRLEPSLDDEFSCSSPATALTVCSIGRVMSCSISCGPTPGYRTMTLTVGYVTSGSRSTGRRVTEIPPSRMMIALIMNIVTGRAIAMRGILIAVPTLEAHALHGAACVRGTNAPHPRALFLAVPDSPGCCPRFAFTPSAGAPPPRRPPRATGTSAATGALSGQHDAIASTERRPRLLK